MYTHIHIHTHTQTYAETPEKKGKFNSLGNLKIAFCSSNAEELNIRKFSGGQNTGIQ
jgi:hypothetical protein